MISLRDYTLEDLDRLVVLADNRNVSRYLIDTFPFPYTREDGIWWIESGCSDSGAITKVVEYDGQFVGSVGLVPQTGWKKHVAEIGYWIAEQYWGNGIATVAAREMSEIAFEEFGFKKLFGPVLAPNTASIRVLEKCGYQSEGLMEREIFKDGEYFDVYQYAKHCS